MTLLNQLMVLKDFECLHVFSAIFLHVYVCVCACVSDFVLILCDGKSIVSIFRVYGHWRDFCWKETISYSVEHWMMMRVVDVSDRTDGRTVGGETYTFSACRRNCVCAGGFFAPNYVFLILLGTKTNWFVPFNKIIGNRLDGDAYTCMIWFAITKKGD